MAADPPRHFRWPDCTPHLPLENELILAAATGAGVGEWRQGRARPRTTAIGEEVAWRALRRAYNSANAAPMTGALLPCWLGA